MVNQGNRWGDLNNRQRLYLRAVYDIDQENEVIEKSERARGKYNRPPASEWRWINYTPLTSDKRLHDRIEDTNIDTGTGSTFEALESRGLIECRYTPSAAVGSFILWVKMTTIGRKLIRQSLEDKPQRKPKGLLSFYSWKAMKLAYEAQEAGVESTGPGFFANIAWSTWVRLRNRNPSLVDEKYVKGEGFNRTYVMVIQPAGKVFYEARLPIHREAFPELYQEMQVSTDAIVVQHSAQVADPFDELETLALRTLESAASARVYGQTFRAWRAYCESQGISPLSMLPGEIVDFLASQDTTKTTRQRQLSAMRKLAQMAYILQPDEETRRIYEALKIIKAPEPSADSRGQERTRRALAPSQADKLLRQWEGTGCTALRNRALVAVLLLGGIRRSEAAALRWSDVDFENGILHIRHGKGDKVRDVPLAGDFALEALRNWQMAQPLGYVNVFTPVERGDHIGKDRQLSGTDVYRIWDATAQAAEVESKPHDARRTFITEALATGTPIQTVQAVAGHSRGETTLRYAQGVDARRARKELKLRYG